MPPDNKIQNGDKTLLSEEMDNGTGRVTFTVKEILADISKKIDQINVKLDSKVDRPELDLLASKITILEVKRATSDALKTQQDEIAKLYLRQWETMQEDVAALKTQQITSTAIQKGKDDWKILWLPIIGNALVTSLYIIYSIVK